MLLLCLLLVFGWLHAGAGLWCYQCSSSHKNQAQCPAKMYHPDTPYYEPGAAVQCNDDSNYTYLQSGSNGDVYYPVWSAIKFSAVSGRPHKPVKVVLSPIKQDSVPSNEIIIGGNNNQESSVSRLSVDIQTSFVNHTPCKKIFLGGKYVGFILNWRDLKVTLTRVGESKPLLTMDPFKTKVGYFGIATPFSSGSWEIQGRCGEILHTKKEKRYNFMVAPGSKQLFFKVRAEKDARIALLLGPDDVYPLTEFIIGGWDNTLSAIRQTIQDEIQDVSFYEEVRHQHLIKGGTFVAFRISYYSATGGIEIARQDDVNGEPFMTWTDPDPLPINYYSVCTNHKDGGKWKFGGDPLISTPDKYQYEEFNDFMGELHFKVSAVSDAHILLTGAAGIAIPSYEIILGANGNKDTVIRSSRLLMDKMAENEDTATTNENYVEIYMKWIHSEIISVALDKNSTFFKTYYDLNIRYVVLTSNTSAIWKIVTKYASNNKINSETVTSDEKNPVIRELDWSYGIFNTSVCACKPVQISLYEDITILPLHKIEVLIDKNLTDGFIVSKFITTHMIAHHRELLGKWPNIIIHDGVFDMFCIKYTSLNESIKSVMYAAKDCQYPEIKDNKTFLHVKSEEIHYVGVCLKSSEAVWRIVNVGDPNLIHTSPGVYKFFPAPSSKELVFLVRPANDISVVFTKYPYHNDSHYEVLFGVDKTYYFYHPRLYEIYWEIKIEDEPRQHLYNGFRDIALKVTTEIEFQNEFPYQKMHRVSKIVKPETKSEIKFLLRMDSNFIAYFISFGNLTSVKDKHGKTVQSKKIILIRPRKDILRFSVCPSSLKSVVNISYYYEPKAFSAKVKVKPLIEPFVTHMLSNTELKVESYKHIKSADTYKVDPNYILVLKCEGNKIKHENLSFDEPITDGCEFSIIAAVGESGWTCYIEQDENKSNTTKLTLDKKKLHKYFGRKFALMYCQEPKPGALNEETFVDIRFYSSTLKYLIKFTIDFFDSSHIFLHMLEKKMKSVHHQIPNLFYRFYDNCDETAFSITVGPRKSVVISTYGYETTKPVEFCNVTWYDIYPETVNWTNITLISKGKWKTNMTTKTIHVKKDEGKNIDLKGSDMADFRFVPDSGKKASSDIKFNLTDQLNQSTLEVTLTGTGDPRLCKVKFRSQEPREKKTHNKFLVHQYDKKNIKDYDNMDVFVIDWSASDKKNYIKFQKDGGSVLYNFTKWKWDKESEYGIGSFSGEPAIWKIPDDPNFVVTNGSINYYKFKSVGKGKIVLRVRASPGGGVVITIRSAINLTAIEYERKTISRFLAYKIERNVSEFIDFTVYQYKDIFHEGSVLRGPSSASYCKYTLFSFDWSDNIVSVGPPNFMNLSQAYVFYNDTFSPLTVANLVLKSKMDAEWGIIIKGEEIWFEKNETTNEYPNTVEVDVADIQTLTVLASTEGSFSVTLAEVQEFPYCFYEIVITRPKGIEIHKRWMNYTNVIKATPDGMLEALPGDPDYDYDPLWIRYTSEGNVSVGRQGFSQAAIRWVDPEPFKVTHFGLATGPGVLGKFKAKGPSHIDTSYENSTEFFYYNFPKNKDIVKFKVKATRDVHVVLVGGFDICDPAMKIDLYTEDLKYNIFRKTVRFAVDNQIVETKDIFPRGVESKLNWFWVSWSGGAVRAGIVGDAEPFIMLEDPQPLDINYYVVSSAPDHKGIWKLQGIQGLITTDGSNDIFYPVSGEIVNFGVNTSSYACVTLTVGDSKDLPFYEVWIGVNNKSMSAIRIARVMRLMIKTISTPDILSEIEPKTFLVSFDHKGNVSILIEGEDEPFMSWVDPNPFRINYFSLEAAGPVTIIGEEDTRVCFFRSWKKRSAYKWIEQRGCYNVSYRNEFGMMPFRMIPPVHRYSCVRNHDGEGVYKICICAADFCNACCRNAAVSAMLVLSVITALLGRHFKTLIIA